jgi:hypothetical protein
MSKDISNRISHPTKQCKETAMSEAPPANQPNTLGKASLALGTVALALVFGIGLCAIVGTQQGWIQIAGTPLFVCGASSAFLGLVGLGLGIAGLFGSNRSRATAIVGLVLGLSSICLFLFALNTISG